MDPEEIKALAARLRKHVWEGDAQNAADVIQALSARNDELVARNLAHNVGRKAERRVREEAESRAQMAEARLAEAERQRDEAEACIDEIRLEFMAPGGLHHIAPQVETLLRKYGFLAAREAPAPAGQEDERG